MNTHSVSSVAVSSNLASSTALTTMKTKKNTETCTICADTYNKSSRCKTPCSYCEFSACNSCWQTHFLNETLPICMNTECKREWTRKYMREHLTNVFMNTKYKKHNEDLLYEKEKTFMPATQPLVEREIQHEKFIIKVNDINMEIAKLMQQRRKLEIDDVIAQGKSDEELCKKTFVRSCSKNECRGFLSTQWKCGICETWTCPECHENKGLERDGEHVCDPNNVASAKLISSDSRPCPKCRAVIFKIDGCDQMFCTMCHTAFSWKTGRLETVIHNPHYFEWVNRNGGAERNPLDIQCGREIRHEMLTDIDRAIRNQCKNIVGFTHEKFRETTRGSIGPVHARIIRGLIHLRYVIINQYNDEPHTRNQIHRIHYMRNRISEEQFKRIIQIEDKKQRKENELMRLYQVLRDVVTDIIHRFHDHICNEGICDYNIINEVVPIVEYVNDCLKDISMTYNSVQYAFTYDLSDRYIVKKETKSKKNISSHQGQDEEDSETENDIISLK